MFDLLTIWIFIFFWNKHLSKYQTLCPSFEGKDIWPLRLFKWLDTWPLQSTILDIFLFYWNKIILYFSKNTSKNQTLCPSFEGKHIWPLTSLNDFTLDLFSLPFITLVDLSVNQIHLKSLLCMMLHVDIWDRPSTYSLSLLWMTHKQTLTLKICSSNNNVSNLTTFII